MIDQVQSINDIDDKDLQENYDRLFFCLHSYLEKIPKKGGSKWCPEVVLMVTGDKHYVAMLPQHEFNDWL